jgi:hypothetical protein
MDASSLLRQISGDLMYAGMGNLAEEALGRAHYNDVQRNYEDAMFNLWANNLQRRFGALAAPLGGGSPPMPGAYAPPYDGPGALSPIPPVPFDPVPAAAQHLPGSAAPEASSKLSEEEQAEMERKLADLRKQQEEAEKKLALLRAHRNRYVDSVRRNGYIVNIPYRFTPDAYYRELGVAAWYAPGLMGQRGTGSAWISREPGAEVYRRMVQDSYEQRLVRPNTAQKLDFANRLYMSYGIVVAGCPPEDLQEPDERNFVVDDLIAIGKTIREDFNEFVVHFDNYRIKAGEAGNGNGNGDKNARKRVPTKFDSHLFEVSLYRKADPLDALALLFVVDGSWMSGNGECGPELAAGLEKISKGMTTAAKKRMAAGLRTRTLTNLGRFLVGLECVATAGTVFSFETEKQYQMAYARAFRDRVKV